MSSIYLSMKESYQRLYAQEISPMYVLYIGEVLCGQISLLPNVHNYAHRELR
jgi:hypothetical protein